MIIKNNSTRLIITLSFLLIIPFVQKQWFNLHLFNINNFSFYSILYYLSGIICPFLVCLNSLNNFTYYKFNRHEINNNKIIKGRALFLLVTLNLILLSYLITYYLHLNFNLIINLFNEGFELKQPDKLQFCFFIFIVAISLIFKKSRFLFKKLVLVNFILSSFIIWYLQINSINVDSQFYFYRYFGLNNINLINVIILVAIEIFYFMWSFLSYRTNLSDWIVHKPHMEDMSHILKIFVFYFFIVIYYTILT